MMHSTRRVAPRSRWIAAAAAVGLLTAACDGGNAFSNNPGDALPQILSIDGPTSIRSGDTLIVTVDARATRGVSEIAVGLSGAATADTAIAIDPASTQTSAQARFVLPDSLSSDQIMVEARAKDVENNESSAAVLAVAVLQGPRFTFLNPAQGQQLQAGLALGIRLEGDDPAGIRRVQIILGNLLVDTMTFDFDPALDSVMIDTAVVIPAGLEGVLELSAEGSNTLDEAGAADVLFLPVSTSGGTDTEAPFVSVDVVAAQRLEVTDGLEVTVTARDAPGGIGLERVGIAVIGVNGPDTLALRPREAADFSPARTGTVVRVFRFTPEQFVDTLALPDTVVFRIHAFAVDASDNCAAAVSAVEQRLTCDGTSLPGDTLASGSAGLRAEVLVVDGRTITLVDGGRIADARVDVTRRRLYLSNIDQNQVELLDFDVLTFQDPIKVGSEPFGLFLNMAEDTLIVANSGGTNLSFVSLDGTPVEDGQRRLFTPNDVLFELTEQIVSGVIRYTGEFFDFSDRPMFVAQDSRGRLLYSTRPTGTAPDGSIRRVDEDPDPGSTADVPEVTFLFVGNAVDDTDTKVSIARVDSMFIVPGGDSPSDAVRIFDHVPGFPQNVLDSGVQPLGDALTTLRAAGSDVFSARGAWVLDEVGLSDTTFMAASGNRRHIAFGEGAADPTGRIIIWNAEGGGGFGSLSAPTEVADILSNASEVVNGIGLNADGSLGVARGKLGAYFFTGGNDPVGDLRLQGIFQEGLQDGGAGATFHPLHDTARESNPTTIAFVGTTRQTIKAVDTFHFFELGELFIRDNIAGPLRASLPFSTDNAGRTCPGDPQCVVLKLFGVTGAGGVVVVNVRAEDLAG
ncbi:MAG: hypothetical protein ABFS34_04395 [Gemmatimonadota bacterium]